MLGPLTPKPNSRRFLTWDLEWYPGTFELRLVGVYDERGYRWYKTIEAFLAHELTERNKGRTFFAHAGGKYDIQFVLREIYERCSERFQIEAAFNGSSAFLVHVIDKRGKRKWVFSDTVFLLKAKLADIGEWLGFPKGKVDFDTESFEELVTYNERDCVILYKAIEQLQEELRAMGGELRPTLASSAMQLFRCAYLNTEIITSYSTNERIRTAYFASRVEVFRTRCNVAKYYDINSSFPHSMTKALPANLKGISRKKLPSKGLYFADVDIEIKESYLPPTPYRDKTGRILFPTGKWNSFLSGEDIRLLLEEGHKINRIRDVYEYESFTELADYVHDLYEKKANAEGFKREVYKLLLNSLYGKFAEGQHKEKILFAPKEIGCPHKPKHEGDSCTSMIAPGIYRREEYVHLTHVHVPISAYVTAYSRALLFGYLRKATKFYYCDTDSVICDNELPTSDLLGDLKLEYEIKKGVFVAPKLYRLEFEQGKYKTKKGIPLDDYVRSKGFSSLTGERFDKLVQGESVDVLRQMGIKENIAKLGRGTGDLSPKEARLTKRVHLDRTKRKQYTNGETRPWRIDEIL